MRSAPKAVATEPVGIVISGGVRDDVRPVFWAYMWAPAPELDRAPASPTP